MTKRPGFALAVYGMEEWMISKDSAKLLNNLFENHNDLTETNNTKRFHPTVVEIKSVLDELHIEGKNCQVIRIEETSNRLAVPPHADGPIGYESMIIPLSFRGKVCTILFDSYYKNNNDNPKGFKYRPTKNKYYKNEWLSPDDEIPSGLSNKPFQNKNYDKLLSYLPIEDLFGLQIKKIVPWQERHIIKFNSNQLHSGSHFKGKKRWLLIIKKIF